jgi:aspartyl aminopeptidase
MRLLHASTKSCAILAAAVLSLSGCRSMGDSAYAPPPKAAPPVATTFNPRIETDEAYVAYVESVARRRGVLVQWVNKPQKRKVDRQE